MYENMNGEELVEYLNIFKYNKISLRICMNECETFFVIDKVNIVKDNICFLLSNNHGYIRFRTNKVAKIYENSGEIVIEYEMKKS